MVNSLLSVAAGRIDSRDVKNML